MYDYTRAHKGHLCTRVCFFYTHGNSCNVVYIRDVSQLMKMSENNFLEI